MTAAEEQVQAILHKELDEAGYALVASLRNLRAEIKGLTALEAEAKAQLRSYLGTASVATVDGEPVARVDQVFRESFDAEAAAANPVYAEMLRACTRVSSYVTVRLV